MKATIIYNPAAGQRNRAEELSQIAQLLEQEGWEVQGVSLTRGPGDATVLAREAASAGADVAVVIGGDGTIAQAVDGLVGTDTGLAVLPAGTGNVMARQLGLPISSTLWPHSLKESMTLLLAGAIKPVDVGCVTVSEGSSHHFLCWCGIGFDAQVNRAVDLEPVRKQRLGLMAFVVAGLMTLREFGGVSASVRVDDGRRRRRRLIMLVANNIQLYGVFMQMAPLAVLDDGRLDFYAFQGRGTAQTVLHALRLFAKRHVQDPKVEFFQARRLEIRTSRPLPVHVDGNVVGQTPAVVSVRPAALRLMVPSTAPVGLFAGPG